MERNCMHRRLCVEVSCSCMGRHTGRLVSEGCPDHFASVMVGEKDIAKLASHVAGGLVDPGADRPVSQTRTYSYSK